MAHPPIAKHSLHLQDFSPEQLLEAVRGANFEHYILTRARCDARLERWSCENFTVDVGRYSFPVRAIGAFPSRKLFIGYMRKSPQPAWVNGVEADQRTMEFYPEGTELNYRAAPNSEWLAIEFDEHALQAAAQKRLGHNLELPWKHVVSFRVPRSERAALDRMVRCLWTHPVSGALMIGPILGKIAEILDGLRRKLSREADSGEIRRVALLTRADDYLRASIAHPFDLKSLANAVGANARSLQRYFMDAYGLTPLQWARCLALHHVRKRLLASNLKKFTIEGAAREYGFRHMGRFSIHYRELFGESPIETLRRGVEPQPRCI